MNRLFWTITLISLILIVSSVHAVEYEPDLMIYYPYEEGEIVGDTVQDVTGTGGPDGTGYHGTINGNIVLVDDGEHGKVAKFAKTSYIDIHGEDIPAGETPTEAFTLCAWVKCENTADHQTLFNARASDQTWLIHPEIRSNGQFRWLLRADGGATIFEILAGKVEWDTWLHYAGTYDKKDGGILYINGELIQEAQGKLDIAKDWGMGARVGYDIDDARPFTGLMNDWCIWKRALTQEEIADIMENGVAPQALSPKGHLTTTWGRLKQ